MTEAPEHSAGPPVSYAVSIELLRGEDEHDTKLLREMAQEAVEYALSFEWCLEIHERYFGSGIGGVVALFLFDITIKGSDAPEWLWIIVGDLPSVYLEFEAFPTPRSALIRYIEGVEEWLEASPAERASGEIIPIDVPADPEIFEMLRGRVATLRSSILPQIREN